MRKDFPRCKSCRGTALELAAVAAADSSQKLPNRRTPLEQAPELHLRIQRTTRRLWRSRSPRFRRLRAASSLESLLQSRRASRRESHRQAAWAAAAPLRTLQGQALRQNRRCLLLLALAVAAVAAPGSPQCRRWRLRAASSLGSLLRSCRASRRESRRRAASAAAFRTRLASNRQASLPQALLQASLPAFLPQALLQASIQASLLQALLQASLQASQPPASALPASQGLASVAPQLRRRTDLGLDHRRAS
mmetsp:Transcript_22615/g.73515  ORF Transcript_22615/g.73515 Transcript_22615/m.73515 type:complete len:250 (+) Transcript_22615:100-849(+)